MLLNLWSKLRFCSASCSTTLSNFSSVSRARVFSASTVSVSTSASSGFAAEARPVPLCTSMCSSQYTRNR